MTAAVIVAACAVAIPVGVSAVHGFFGDLGRRPCRHFGIFHHFERFVRATVCTMIGPTHPAPVTDLK